MGWLTPARRRGFEILDDPATPGPLRERSQRDVARSNTLLGGTRAVLRELRVALPRGGPVPTLLDVGTGLADIPARAARHSGALTTVGCDIAVSLLAAARGRMTHAVCGDALALPFATGSVDVVICSQLLHHFVGDDAMRLVRELHRVARHAVIVSDLRRSWMAATGFWLVSFPLGFHAVMRHDGVVSVLRGFTAGELAALVRDATGATPRVRRRLGYRLTAVWSPREAGR